MPGLTREQIESVDVSGYVDDVLAMPQHLEDALWRVESASLERVLGSSDDLGPLLVCGMGGSAIGGDLAAAVARRAPAAPASDGARLRAADVGHAQLGGPVRQLLRQHRGDACLLRRGGRAGRDPHRGHDRRPPGRRGPRRRRSGDPAAGGSPAPGGGRLHACRGARGGGARRASRCISGPRSTLPRRRSWTSLRAGGRTPTRTASRSGSRSECTRRACASTGPGRPRRSRCAGRPRSTRTRRCRPSAAELPEADHNEIVRLGERGLAGQLHGACSWRTPTSTRACVSVSS